MSITKRISILILSIIGILLSAKLTVIYLDANFNPYALSSFCSINEFIDCDGVAKTTHSQAFGIPLCIWGLIFYAFILFLLFVDKLQKIRFLSFLKVFKNPESYIYSLGSLAFIISIFLACLSIFEIKKICILCFATYFINLAIALIARKKGSRIFGDVKQSFLDFFQAIKIRRYLISFIILSIIGISFLVYTTQSLIFVPQVKKLNSIISFQNVKGNPYNATGNYLGEDNAKIVIHEYTDFECPHCSILNIMLQRAASELGNIKVVHHNFPLDQHCNKYLDFSMHENSCQMARYALAAEKQGKYWDLNNLLFSEKPDTEDKILELAKSVGIDITKLQNDANSKEIENALLKSIDQAASLNIYGTPTMVINSKVYTGIKPYYELKQLLIDLGAKEKK